MLLAKTLGVIGLVVIIGVQLTFGLHKVEEGHVGIYWFGGKLQNKITAPGYHTRFPGETFRQIQVTMQTDQVRDIPCGTSGGVVLYFDKIEVVNRLKQEYVFDTIRNYTTDYDKTWIFDKVHHAINEFCSVHTLQEVYITMFDQLDEALKTALLSNLEVWAPGIEIIAIRVTKPRIPERIRASYEMVEAEKTGLLIANQKQNVVLKAAETLKVKAISEAEKALAVADITTGKMVAEKEREKELADIENDVHVAREKNYADAEFYKAKLEAEGNAALLSEAYLKRQKMLSLTSNSQFWLGDSIPTSLRINAPTF